MYYANTDSELQPSLRVFDGMDWTGYTQGDRLYLRSTQFLYCTFSSIIQVPHRRIPSDQERPVTALWIHDSGVLFTGSFPMRYVSLSSSSAGQQTYTNILSLTSSSRLGRCCNACPSLSYATFNHLTRYRSNWWGTYLELGPLKFVPCSLEGRCNAVV